MKFILTLTFTALLALSAAGQERNINLSLDGAAVASASSTVNANFPASAAIDGDRKGYGWEAGGGWNDQTRSVFPDWLQVTFPRPMSVGRAVVVSLQDSFQSPAEPSPTQTCALYGVKDFQIQYFDGTQWQTAATVTGNTLCVREVVFVPKRSAQWRVLVTATGDGLYSRIVESEYYPL